MKRMKKKELPPLLPSHIHTIPPNLYPTLPPTLGSYKVDIFCLFPFKS